MTFNTATTTSPGGWTLNMNDAASGTTIVMVAIEGYDSEGNVQWVVTTTYPDGTSTSMKFPFSAEDLCGVYPDLCMDADGGLTPDIVAICEDPYQLPPETFEGTNFLSLCDVDYDFACEVAPELCVDGGFSTDLCGIYPEMCDESSDDYNECAVDLYNCIMDEDFDMCIEFPELCGLLVDVEIPPFMPVYEDYRRESILSSGEVLYTCKGEFYAIFKHIKDVIDFGVHGFGYDIYPGREKEFTLAAGARKYSRDAST